MDKRANMSENETKNLLRDSEGKSVDTLMEERLTQEQQKAVKSVLSNPEKLQKILSSPLAKRFLEKLSRGEE